VHHVTIGGNEDLAAMFDKPTDTGDAVELRMRVRVPVTAGPHEVTATFIENLAVKDTIRLQPFLRSSADNFDWAGRPHIQTFTITGPFNATGIGDTASRREIFTCRPTTLRQAQGRPELSRGAITKAFAASSGGWSARSTRCTCVCSSAATVATSRVPTAAAPVFVAKRATCESVAGRSMKCPR
jgi:hypothetical protein